MNVKLVVVQGKPEGKEIPLRTPKFLVGRGTECHLRPNSELISRHHCMFIIGDNGVTVRDLGSTNGTLVNGERVQGEVAVLHEDVIQMGPLGFRVVMESVTAESSPALQPIASLTAAAEPGTVIMAKPKVAILGRKDHNEGEIEQYLVSDSKHDVPDGGSGVYSGDTGMLQNTTVDQKAGQGTSPEVTPPPIGSEPLKQKESEEKVVELEGGGKLKIASAKQKIDKTPEDTSRAAADILRRMMERRRGK